MILMNKKKKPLDEGGWSDTSYLDSEGFSARSVIRDFWSFFLFLLSLFALKKYFDQMLLKEQAPSFHITLRGPPLAQGSEGDIS